MKITKVVVAAGVTATDVPATIPSHFVRITEDAAVPAEALAVTERQSDGTFSAEVTYPIGSAITLTNHTIIARPAEFSYKGQLAEVYAKVRTASGNPVTLRVTEHEHAPSGNY